MLKTYSGSCHCQAVRFEADADISAGTGKCNCSICAKMRIWLVKVSADHVRILAGEGELTDFRGDNPVAHHPFCRHCGIHVFTWVGMPNMTGYKYYNINIACLEAVDVDELMAAPVRYFDGLNNDWGSAPKEIRHL